MSRYDRDCFDYDEPFPNAGVLYAANAERALKGKRGRKVLAELREALWYRKVVKDGLSPEEAFDALPTLDTDEGGLEATAEVAKEAGIVYSLAWQLAYRNDEMFDGMSPEERYDAFLAWLDQELATPAVGG
jgi:hypothetical protein